MIGRPNKITGIYLGDTGIEAVTISMSRRGSWSVLESAPFPEESSAPIAEQVKAFLTRLETDRRRRITFAVTEKRVFFREIKFPQLSTQEAISAVRMAIDLHAHLRRDEIYFDVFGITEEDAGDDTKKGESKVLLAYIERSFLDPVIDAVRQTGHQRSLGIIAPVSCGIDGILRTAGTQQFPCTVLSRQDDEIRISFHGITNWEGSHSISLFSQSGLAHRLSELARLYPEPFHSLIKSPVFKVGKFQIAELDRQPEDPCSALAPLGPLCKDKELSLAMCAAGIAFKSYPEIAFQEKPRKRPFRIKINAFQVIAILSAAAMITATSIGAFRMMKVSSKVDAVDAKLAVLEKKIKPLLETRAKIDEIEKKKKELSDFTHELPSLLDVLKEIATLTPMDTWIRNFSLSGKKFRLSAEGKSATACIAALRKSRLFTQVKLVSSVTKSKDGNERFSVELIPRLSSGGKK